MVAVATALGATATAIIGYLQSERVLRPVAVAALRGGLPENIRASGVIGRQMLAWALSTGVPLLTIVLAVVADKAEYLHGPPEKLLNPILLLALAALGIGLASTLLVATSIADPLRQLRWALGEVQRGNYNAHMQIYDASELGLLQAGFNDMVRDLSERQRLRDLFGRYVGEDVARRALERGAELGGQERDVAVLFVDLVGSTELAATRPPAEVVLLLNEFFRVVVDTVGRHGGFVNKFQGDAALAIFGAPIEHPDASGGALAAARELHDELLPVIGSAEFGIGVSSGRAIAGHIGALARFEYTVIGDPVNEAARLTELAKLEDGHVLASAVAVSGALDAEALVLGRCRSRRAARTQRPHSIGAAAQPCRTGGGVQRNRLAARRRASRRGSEVARRQRADLDNVFPGCPAGSVPRFSRSLRPGTLDGWSPFGASDSVMFCTTTGVSDPYMTCNKSATDGLFASGLSCVFPESCTAGTSMSRSGGADGAAMMMLTPPSATPAVMQYRSADRMTLLGATVTGPQRTYVTVPENRLRITSF